VISGVGIDVIEVQRVKDSIERFGDRILNRLFTKTEIEYCSARKNAALHFAGRFAAKEAAFKAMGKGWGGDISWKDVEITNLPSGAPKIAFYGKALELTTSQKIKSGFVSISHIDQLATAVVILES
jgi:holo-[acyl-carrier protein] synthase